MIVSIMTTHEARRSYRALAITPDLIASIIPLDLRDTDTEHACLISLKQPVAVDLDKDGKPDMRDVLVVLEDISDLAKDAGLDPDNELQPRYI